MPPNHRLFCDNISFKRDERYIFHRVISEFVSGELTVVKGNNGSGKTTLLQLLAGILTPDEGKILYEGQAITNNRDYKALCLYHGHLSGLHPELSICENLHFWAKIRGDLSLLDAALHYFDLTAYASMQVQTLSAGWKQRTALAKLICCPANVWLLDEPVSHLDEEGIALLESLIATRREQGGIIVMSLHGHVSSEHVNILNISEFDNDAYTYSA